MNYDNIPCPACGAHMHEGDDIVVCPVCGTPQHRTCWTENGECVNVAKHNESYRWSPQETEPPADDDVFRADGPAPGEVPGTVICHICSSENPADIMHCGHCGALLRPGENETPTTKCIYCGKENPADNVHCDNCGAPLTPYIKARQDAFRAITGVEENNVIAGHTAADYALYVRHGAAKYLARFERFGNGKTLSFSLPGLFFGYAWLFSRKIYKQALIIMLLLASAWLAFISSPGMVRAEELIAPYAESFANGTMSPETMSELAPQLYELMKLPVALLMLAVFVANLACALFGSRWYFGKIKKDLDELDAGMPDPGMRSMYLSRRGGLSILSGLCGYFIYSFIQNSLLYIAQFFAERF